MTSDQLAELHQVLNQLFDRWDARESCGNEINAVLNPDNRWGPIRALLAADDNHRALVDGWRPIRTAPRDGTWFLACATAPNWGATRIVYYADKHDRLPIHGEGNIWPSPPTHWMPLPAPPQQAASAAAINKKAPAHD